jgi:tryptophan halogenase
MICKTITIIGGGSSGWLAAAHLTNRFRKHNIVLIDKEESTPVGVGEGTLLNFNAFLMSCGFTTNEWYDQIDATLKSGILFPGWGSKNNSVWHPFSYDFKFDEWSKDQSQDFKDIVLKKYKSSVIDKQIETDKLEHYAYHVDCLKLVQFIKGKVESRPNFKFINSSVNQIIREESGYIKKIILQNKQEIESDLFIDCTGFASLFNTDQEKISLKDRLLCDTAIASHIQYNDVEKELNPYVTSEAIDCGWVWNIPTKQRIGSGIVFNRSITDKDKALDKFNQYWNGRLTKTKVIDWTPYYYRKIWHENVIHVGLSAGFIEPLESTGLALAIEGIALAGHFIETINIQESSKNLYNEIMQNYMETAIDFVNMHYVNNTRDEEFWKIANNELKISNRQKDFIEFLNNTNISLDRSTAYNSVFTYNFFNNYNWFCWLIQLGYPVRSRDEL